MRCAPNTIQFGHKTVERRHSKEGGSLITAVNCIGGTLLLLIWDSFNWPICTQNALTLTFTRTMYTLTQARKFKQSLWALASSLVLIKE